MNTYRIGEAARLTGLSAHSIRFYEESGLLPAASRNDTGYRLYTEKDLRRLRLVRNLRKLGVPMDEVAATAAEAFGNECGHYLRQLAAVLGQQQGKVHQRLLELQALAAELDDLRVEAEAAAELAPAGSLVAECPCCLLIDEPQLDASYCASTDSTHGEKAARLETTDELLEVLSCDFSARPVGAPGPTELAPFLLDIDSDDGQLALTFTADARGALTQFKDEPAEERCCSQLGFEITERSGVLTLAIEGTPEQIAAFKSLWLYIRAEGVVR